MKRISIFLALGIILFFTSCSKSSRAVEKFVGTYSLSATMNASVVIDGYSYAINEQIVKGYLTISQSDDGNNVVEISEFYETTAIINGNTISMNSVQASSSNANEGWTEVLNINFQNGKLDGSTLKFDATITGTHYQGGVAYPIVGTITHVARKL